MLRMSTAFAGRWRAQRLDDELDAVILEPKLRAIVDAPLVRKPKGLVLEPLAAYSTGPEAFQDRTGYEAFVNKIHVDDFIDAAGTAPEQLGALVRQGVKAALELSRRLEAEGPFRILLSLDPESPSATLRFFERREGEAWVAEDPDAFQLEEVLMIDTCC
jgi:hypothetical protein